MEHNNDQLKYPETEVTLDSEVVEEPFVHNDGFAASIAGKEWKTFEVKKRKSKFQMGHGGKALIALGPTLVFLVLFTFYPIVNTFLISFIENFRWVKHSGSFAISNYFNGIAEIKNWETSTPPDAMVWSFKNFKTVFGDPDFGNAIINTLIITVISVPLSIFISLLLAVFLNSIKFMRGFYQTIFFLPYVTNTIAIGMVFSIMFKGYTVTSEGIYQSQGLINKFLGWFGVRPQNWVTLTAPRFNSGVAIIVYNIWNSIAFKVLVFMSGLQSIDKQYYDAARIDGSNRLTIFRRITLPLLSPQVLYIMITSTIGSFKMYTSVISLFSNSEANNGAGSFGGPVHKEWLTIVGYIYINRARTETLAVASAGAVVLLGIILVITAVQMQVSKKRVHY